MQSRPLCVCGNLCKPNGLSKKDGRKLYNTYCRSCGAKRHGGKGNIRRFLNSKIKKDSCEICFFIPVNICQLDVDHIDGDRDNYAPSNIQTLCANCHRLKSFKNRDWDNRGIP